MHGVINKFLEKIGLADAEEAKPAAKPARREKSPQAELHTLCQQLLQSKSITTSGKIQLIGLDKVKRKMGKNWPGMQEIVHTAADEVIREHLGKGDIHIRHQDDTYIIIFAAAAPEEAKAKAALIADGIRAKLFGSGRPALRDIEITRHIVELQGGDMKDAADIDTLARALAGKIFEPQSATLTSMETDSALPSSRSTATYAYLPLWDVNKSALTTYLCEASGVTPGASLLEQDLAMLAVVGAELEAMAEDGRQFFVVCPVHHDTIRHAAHLAIYINACARLPKDFRKFLIIMVVKLETTLRSQATEAYGFERLRANCHQLFIEVNAPGDIAALKNYKFSAVGLRLSRNTGTSQFEILKAASLTFGLPAGAQLFALDVHTLSLATASVCNGFSLIGGDAVHAAVPSPQNIYRYRHETLFSSLSR